MCVSSRWYEYAYVICDVSCVWYAMSHSHTYIMLERISPVFNKNFWLFYSILAVRLSVKWTMILFKTPEREQKLLSYTSIVYILLEPPYTFLIMIYDQIMNCTIVVITTMSYISYHHAYWLIATTISAKHISHMTITQISSYIITHGHLFLIIIPSYHHDHVMIVMLGYYPRYYHFVNIISFVNIVNITICMSSIDKLLCNHLKDIHMMVT